MCTNFSRIYILAELALNQVRSFMNMLLCLFTLILTENRADALIHDYANKWLSSIFSCFR